MIHRLTLVLCCGLWVAGCGTAAISEGGVASYFWVAAPMHYDVWVEHLELGRSANYKWNQPPGGISCCWRGPQGPKGVGGRLEPFPDYIRIRWFSFAEQKFYQHLMHVPPGWGEKMQERAPHHTHLNGVVEKRRNRLVLGLAPGGQIVVWLMSQIGNEIEVERFQANEVDGDISTYQKRTEEYRESSGTHLETHGIPLEGW